MRAGAPPELPITGMCDWTPREPGGRPGVGVVPGRLSATLAPGQESGGERRVVRVLVSSTFREMHDQLSSSILISGENIIRCPPTLLIDILYYP